MFKKQPKKDRKHNETGTKHFFGGLTFHFLGQIFQNMDHLVSVHMA